MKSLFIDVCVSVCACVYESLCACRLDTCVWMVLREYYTTIVNMLLLLLVAGMRVRIIFTSLSYGCSIIAM